MRGEASKAIRGEAMNTERSECTERTERTEYIVYLQQTMHILRRGETDHAPNEKTAKTTQISNYGAFGEVHRID